MVVLLSGLQHASVCGIGGFIGLYVVCASHMHSLNIEVTL
jgi:hypothetical protein